MFVPIENLEFLPIPVLPLPRVLVLLPVQPNNDHWELNIENEKGGENKLLLISGSGFLLWIETHLPIESNINSSLS